MTVLILSSVLKESERDCVCVGVKIIINWLKFKRELECFAKAC